MTNLIIGCGYLGRRVAQIWFNQGRAVLGTTRSDAAAAELAALGIEPIVCDVLDPASLVNLPQVDSVVYAIGHDRSSGHSMREVYTKGLGHVLANLPVPKRLIYVSSTSVYGQENEEWVDESSPAEPTEESGQIVLEAETIVRSLYPEAILLRLAGLYGPGRLLRRQAVEKGESIRGNGTRWLNLIHVDDAAAAVVAAEIRGGAGMTYLIADGRPVRRHDFYAELARLLGAAPPRFAAPDPKTASAGHERANRRINNRRMLEELRVTLAYPDYRAGLAASIDAGRVS